MNRGQGSGVGDQGSAGRVLDPYRVTMMGVSSAVVATFPVHGAEHRNLQLPRPPGVAEGDGSRCRKLSTDGAATQSGALRVGEPDPPRRRFHTGQYCGGTRALSHARVLATLVDCQRLAHGT